ncbi:spore protease YyaC [Sporosarcina jeotgali]|uniref:Spore protease YyaC n=1 Tax=Sporosarcina jeotgali TaxID=3020056 RepID=A0ABZ0KZK6_9BACL|nr:spore protease YyaC [Sporosarcina sp. B2O-1]WOV84349.1 spore protease YyaC [Sporosarcina sp. B2O-1]
MQKLEQAELNSRIHYKETGAVWKLSTLFLENIPFTTREILFLCIGTDRSTGDALGPLVGSLLTETRSFPYRVIGTLEDPLHALNIEERVTELAVTHPDAYFVAVDACLGKSDSVGHLLVQDGPLQPGKAVGKELPSVGDIAIKGVVNIGGFMEHSVLQSTRLHLSYEMGRTISRALQLAHGRLKSKRVYDTYNQSHYRNSGNEVRYSDLSQAD